MEVSDTSNSGEITRLMARHQQGDETAWDQAVGLLYDELRALAHSQLGRLRINDTMQTTALVNEVYLKLKAHAGDALDQDHFMAIAATAMRQVVIDYARSRRAIKRGGAATHIDIDESVASVESQAAQLLDIDRALTLLAEQQPRWVQVFECKFFVGLDDNETAAALSLSKRTAQRDWLKARAFLAEQLVVDE